MKVGLFIPCYVDQFFPEVGRATVEILEAQQIEVDFPQRQTCCGQPAYNTGDRADARAIARLVIDDFESFDYVVVPSGSCAGMVRCHYPQLFADDPSLADRARRLADKTWELVSFLTDVCGRETVPGTFRGSATYHDGCSGLRELGVRDQPRRLLAAMADVTMAEHEDAEVCCGFGGTFCIKSPDISTTMVNAKIASIEKAGVDLVLAGDLGCLLNIAGRLSRRGSKVQVRHVAEILSGMTDDPPIAGAVEGGR